MIFKNGICDLFRSLSDELELRLRKVGFGPGFFFFPGRKEWGGERRIWATVLNGSGCWSVCVRLWL